MKQKYFTILDCKKAEEFCDKAEYQETNIIGKLRLRLHLFFCKNCQKYHQRNKKLSSLLQKADLHTCTKEEKSKFKLQLEREGVKNLP